MSENENDIIIDDEKDDGEMECVGDETTDDAAMVEDTNVVKVDFTPSENDDQSSNNEVEEDNDSGKYLKSTLEQTAKSLKVLRDILEQMCIQYKNIQSEFDFDESHMKAVEAYISQYNVEHDLKVTEETSEEDIYITPIRNMPYDKMVEIFGENTDLSMEGDEFLELNRDRISSAYSAWYQMNKTSTAYNQLYDEYSKLLEDYQLMQVDILKGMLDNTEDEKEKEGIQEALDQIIGMRHLDYLSKPMEQAMIERIKNVSNNESKMRYLVNKAIDKLESIGINRRIIVELNGFEERHLDEKYHADSWLLIRILFDAAYSDVHNNIIKRNLIATASVVENYNRHNLNDEEMEAVTKNIIAYEDQLL